jgi:hypothetical protein
MCLAELSDLATLLQVHQKIQFHRENTSGKATVYGPTRLAFLVLDVKWQGIVTSAALENNIPRGKFGFPHGPEQLSCTPLRGKQNSSMTMKRNLSRDMVNKNASNKKYGKRIHISQA